MKTLIRLDQVRRAGSPQAPEAESAFSLGRYFEAACSVFASVGQFVRITGPSVGGAFQVDVADVTDPTTMPALGVILSKPTTTSCLVHVGPGIVSSSVLGIGSLTPQKRYFIGTNSRASATLPTADMGGIALVQIVGHALDQLNLLLTPNYNLIARR